MQAWESIHCKESLNGWNVNSNTCGKHVLEDQKSWRDPPQNKVDNNRVKILWDLKFPTDKHLLANQPDSGCWQGAGEETCSRCGNPRRQQLQKEACKDEEAVGSEGTMATQVKGEVQSGPSGSRSISGCDWLQQISGTCLSSLSRTVQKWLRYMQNPQSLRPLREDCIHLYMWIFSIMLPAS